MDAKDLELLTVLTCNGRADIPYISSEIGVSPPNVHRRMKLLHRSNIINGFSAFFDRRMFGFDTTFVKLHFKMRDMDRIINEVSRMPQVTEVYPNMDDFMLVEVVHWDRDMLASAIRAMERVSRPMTVSAHYVPRFPDEIPEAPEGKDLEILANLVKDGRMSDEAVASIVGLEEEDVNSRISRMMRDGVFTVKPMIQEEMVQPFPTFTTLLLLKEDSSFSSCYSSIRGIGRGVWDCIAIEKPPGVWVKSFGKDLHAMDMMIERFRREDYVEDVMLVIPDSIVIRRTPDISILKDAM